jgi:uncharacterized protein (TIGR02145 family)
MSENLKTRKYKDGTAIPLVTDLTTWANLTTPGYCWYTNDESSHKNTYGALYNWYTVNTGKLCPSGWQVPTVKKLYNLYVIMSSKNNIKKTKENWRLC